MGGECCRCLGYPEAAASDHWQWQAHVAEECAFPASSGQATTLLMSLSLTQGQGGLTLLSLKGEELPRVRGRRDPKDLCPSFWELCLAIHGPGHENPGGGGAAGKWTAPTCPCAHCPVLPTCCWWAAPAAFLGHWALLNHLQLGLWEPPGQVASPEGPADRSAGYLASCLSPPAFGPFLRF